MDIQTKLENGELTVSPVGSLDSNTAGEMEAAVKALWEKEFTTLTLDMSGVDYISSKGVRIAVSLFKAMNARDGKLRFTGLNTAVREVFHLSGLDTIFGLD